MRRLSWLVVALLIAGWSLPVGARQAGDSDEAGRIRDAATVFQEIMNAPDHAIPHSVLDNADAIAVFPSVLKAGFVVGVTRGHGIISVRDAKGTWSSPAFLTITGGSFGAQIGGSSTDLVLIVMNQRGVRDLLRNQFKIGGEAQATAGPVGREAQAATDIQLHAEILSYSRSRGLFAGVSVSGASVRADRDANTRFYGRPYTSRQIVLQGIGGAPEPVGEWRAVLEKFVPAKSSR